MLGVPGFRKHAVVVVPFKKQTEGNLPVRNTSPQLPSLMQYQPADKREGKGHTVKINW